MTRRTGRKQRLEKKSDARQRPECVKYRFGDFEFDPSSRELWRHGRKQAITSKSAQLLALLLKNAPSLVTREQLAAELWGRRKYTDFDDRLNHVVSRLRRSLSESADHPYYIETNHGVGYKMIAPVSIVRPTEPADFSPETAAHPQALIRSNTFRWLSAALVAGVAIATTFAIRTDTTASHDVARPRLAIATPLNLTNDPSIDLISATFGQRLQNAFTELGSVDVTIPATADYELRTAMYAGEDPGLLRLAAVMVSEGNERNLWSGNIARSNAAIDDRQTAAVDAISKQVLRGILPNETARWAMTHPPESETERIHRAGRDALQAGLLNDAINYFNSIAERNPDNALAYSDLARALIHKGWYTAVPSTEVVPRAKAAALAALELDPSLAEPYLALANTSAFYDWDWDAAEALYLKAIHRNPGHAASYLDYAAYLFVIGRIDEGLEQLRQAELADPMSASTHGQIGILYHYIRQWDAAHRHYDAALVLEPENVIWRMHKGCTYIFQGKLERGADMIQQLRAEYPKSPMPMVIEAYYFAVIGDFQRTQQLLNNLDTAELPPLTELMRASIYVALGHEADAVQLLRDSRDQRLLALPLTAIHPTHDPLRKRSDYRALLIDLGLEANLGDRPETAYPATTAIYRTE